MAVRRCRECGIDNIPPGIIVDGELLCWVDDDICSRCDDRLRKDIERDAARYRHLRNRSTSNTAIAEGGVFAGQIPVNLILGGEDLDRAVDLEMGREAEYSGETLEKRLAMCLAQIVDGPLMEGRDEVGGFSSPLQIRLGFFKPDLSERACELLEEAGL